MACKNCTIPFLQFEDGPLIYEKWVNVKDDVLVHGRIKRTTHVFNKKIESTVVECVDILQDEMISYMRHQGVYLHQYRELDAFKKRLSPNEVSIL